MLFISRCIDFDKYGVVDTDDGIEEVVANQELSYIINRNKLRIQGVSYSRREKKLIVYPWQDPSTLSKLQLKTAMVNKVHVLTHRGIVSSIRWSNDAVSEPAVIRASDFGHTLADWVFSPMKVCAGRHKMTLVLDDKVTLSDLSLLSPLPLNPLGKEGIGVVTDVSEIKSPPKVVDAYWQLIINRFTTRDTQIRYTMVDSIIDDNQRKAKVCTLIRKFLDYADECEEYQLMGYEGLKQELLGDLGSWY